MALTEHDSLIFVDTAMHRGSDRTACEVTIFRSREMCYDMERQVKGKWERNCNGDTVYLHVHSV